MDKNIWIGIIVVVVVLVGGYMLFGQRAPTQQTPSEQSSTTNTNTTPTSGDANTGSITVTYTDQGFSPSTITVKQGQSVTFQDNRQSSKMMWIASDPHPAHSGYDGTSRSQHCVAGYTSSAPFDECSPGRSFTFTFNKVGSWGYHDHFDDNMTGTVIVQ